MRHRKSGSKLGRRPAHRMAMLRNMAASLFEHGQVVTTVPKAKQLRPFVEKIITIAKRDDVHARRLVTRKLGHDRKAFEWVYLPKNADDDERRIVEKQRDMAETFFDIPDSDEVERNRYGELRKAPKLVRHIFENVAPRFADRDGGYTRIVRLPTRRKGDGGELCVIQFVGAEEGEEYPAVGSGSTRKKIAEGRKAYFEKLAAEQGIGGGRPGGGEAPTPETATAVAEPEAEGEDVEPGGEEPSDGGDEESKA